MLELVGAAYAAMMPPSCKVITREEDCAGLPIIQTDAAFLHGVLLQTP